MSDISQNTTIGGDSSNPVEQNGGTVSSGVGLYVSSGGTASNVTVGSGGYINVYTSGTAISALVSGTSAVLNVSSGGVTSNTSVIDGANILISAGGISDNDLVEANGQEAVWGSANNLTISGDNTHAYLQNGGTGTNWTAEDGAWVGVYSGTSLDGFKVTGQNTYGDISGGLVKNASVADSGVLQIENGVTISGITAASKGQVYVSKGGSTTGTILSDSGTAETVLDGGSASGTQVTSGAGLTVSDGGLASGTTVSGNSNLFVSGGTITDTTITGSNGFAYMYSGSVASGTTHITNGGEAILYSNAKVDSATVDSAKSILQTYDNAIVNSVTASNGGSAVIDDNSYVSSATAISGGDVSLWGSATVDAITVGSAGTLETNSQSVISSLTAMSGGSVETSDNTHIISATTSTNGDIALYDNTVADTVTVGNSGILETYDSTKVSSIIANSGGSISAWDNSTIVSATVNSGGNIIFADNATLTGTVTLENGGNATILAGTSGIIDMAGNTNTGVVISGLTSGGTVTTMISGFNGQSAGSSDGIQLVGLQAADVTSVTYTSADQVALSLTNGKTVTLNIAGAESAGYTLVPDTNGDLIYEVCFLSGSMIRTLEGDVAVENIQIGDQVVTFDWESNKNVSRPVTWVGKTHATVRPDLPHDEAGYPVRVVKDAIADGVPYKDMLITAEHCLFFEGKFVPVRMLVNGVSIFYDTSITSYDYYHVETEQHSVITADGMLTESYLDTGNRCAFRQEGKIATLRRTTQSWEDDAAAPLCVERAFVEPLFRKLEARNNNGIKAEQAELVIDPDLHLITENGASIRPFRHDGQRYSFMLPANTYSVSIVSRASRPADVIGPFVDDRRQMGVAVSEVRLLCAKQTHAITAHLQAEKPKGWYNEGWTDCAWTNGHAELPLGNHLTHGKMGVLSITVKASGPYIIQNQEITETKLRSA
ncbi:Hint domain-containing protein [Acetobacter pasteurianus]|uniref:Hint domain-containing protein n=1 Tax=Acetobacter pasteurianus TaxID=438 RepID=UPI003D0A3C3D